MSEIRVRSLVNVHYHCIRCGNPILPWQTVMVARDGNIHWGYTKDDQWVCPRQKTAGREQPAIDSG